MKILSFGHIPSWAGGKQSSGLANVIYQLSKHMADYDGVEVSLVATDVFESNLQHDNLKIYGWTKRMLIKYVLTHLATSIKWLLSIVNAKRKFGPVISIMGFFLKGLHLLRCIDMVKPDVIHLHGMNACVYEKIIPSNVKIIVTIHGIIGENSSIPFYTHRYKMERELCLSNRFSLIIFIADKLITDFSDLYGVINSPTKAILNAYDAQSFYYIKPKIYDKLSLITIASFSENKGQKRVIEAISKCGVDCKYICIGAAKETEITEYTLFSKKLNVDFEYLGKKKPMEIREYLSEADFMILPSLTEGFGLVYLEAIACGVPVIIPQHLPIVQEVGIIQPEVNALLLKDSSVESIIELLPKLKSMKFDRKKVANSIINYSWDGIAKQYIEIIENII